MPASELTTETAKTTERSFPKIEKGKDGSVVVQCHEPGLLTGLLGTKTDEVARGLFASAMQSLGTAGELYRPLLSAICAELEPRDAVEAMLITQMTATHVGITALSQKMMDQNSTPIRESAERSMTRLSRTFIAQMDALKKYRAKAQQIVRVERVNVESGGKAIVGDVNHGGRVEHEK